jgi:RNA polymerase sigma-70 factor (sigma-E family)
VTPADLPGEARPGAHDPDLEALPRTDALYRQHFPGAIRLAYLLTSDASTAEDIAQEAFLAAAPRLMGLNSPEAFAAYLRRTVVRRVLMRARGTGREITRWERIASQRIDTTTDPTAETAARLDLLTALRQLPTKQRTALVLRYWEDLPEQDIAALLRCRRGTVKSTLSRALDTLRKDLADDGRP